MRINIKRLARTAEKLNMIIAQEQTEEGATVYTLTGGTLGADIAEYESAEEVRDALEHFNKISKSNMNANAQLIAEEPEKLLESVEGLDYLKITDTKKRAKALGLKLNKQRTGDAKSYTISGGFLTNALGIEAKTFYSWGALEEEITTLWETATEPVIDYYCDDDGTLHQRLRFPSEEYIRGE